MVENKKIHTPLLAVVKRNDLPTYKAILIRILTFVVTFFLSMLICFFVIKENYFEIIGTLFEGATFVAKNKILPWNLIKETALLLAFAIAIIPAFKMKYWNMGANGQVLMGALNSIVLMFYLNNSVVDGKISNTLL